MALFEEGLVANGLSTGLVVGIGAVVLVGPMLLPVVATVAKPLVKGVIKTGMTLYDKGNEVVAEVGEMIEDLMAEVKSEMPGEAKSRIIQVDQTR
jgi:Protein of unknown function (DUF5132)